MNHYILGLMYFLHFETLLCEKASYGDFTFIIISQRDPVHENKALVLESEIKMQTFNQSNVFLTHRDFNHLGDWTVIPILEKLWTLMEDRFLWLIFCTEQTKFNVSNLVLAVEKYNSEESFVGRALQDVEPTIIHHFASIPGFKYPLFASGFGLNHRLMKRLMASVARDKFMKNDFSIDASHELAMFLRNNLNGTFLVNNFKFCLDYRENCATYVFKDELCEGVDIGKIFFAIKTCEKFHKTRIPIVKSTWGKKSRQLAFFSERYDENIPTVELHVPNSERGHCMKTEAIFKIMSLYLTKNDNLQWVLLSDDDTILSVRRIQQLVGCYDPNTAYVIGERYGFDIYSSRGYNYITGGGGAVLSRKAILELAESKCKCPSESTPDDMFLLGICVQRLNITMIHVPLFHQARPSDYSEEYLKIGLPISFHKHWMTDPVEIYESWFKEADTSEAKEIHSEL